MQSIALPKKIEFKKSGKDSNQAEVIIEPCYPGYGTTIGNSLRRVLLSSLRGAAVVGVKIKGANHEFMTLPHIKEDVLEIILNLKQLRVKLYGEEPVKLELEVAGEKEVKASDIKKNSQAEIANSDLFLAHITDMAGNLNMEIFVAPGRGYETIESRERTEKHEIGYIEMDSLFSPVLAVSIDIENVRVGKMTNWEKLILNIKTDGTITPEEALKQATEVLIDQFGSIMSLARGEKAVEEAVEEKEEIKEEIIAKEELTEKEESGADEPKKRRGRPKKNE
jgi:DNA-directed RNA polymerase subunit alpha